MKTTWDLTKLYAGDNDPKIESDKKIISVRIDTFVSKWKDRDDYLHDPETLREILDEYESIIQIAEEAGDPGYYFFLRAALHIDNPDIKAKYNQMSMFEKEIHGALRFFTLQLAKIPKEHQSRLSHDPRIEKYRYFLEHVFESAQYDLGESTEKACMLLSETSYEKWVYMTRALLTREEYEIISEDGKSEIKNYSEIIGLLLHKNKTVREAAAKVYFDILDKHSDVAEAEMNAVLGYKKTMDTLRGLPRPDTDRHINDNIRSETVDTLITTTSDHFDIAHRFYALKAKLTGVEKLKYYERGLPYGNINKTFSYEESVSTVRSAFQSIDPEFASIFDMFVENGHIDVYPKKNKDSRIFCTHETINSPVYILLNYTGKFLDVTSLAHECGHGIHNELQRKQHALYFGSSKATAEVASTFMEKFALDELARNATEEEQLTIMIQQLDEDIFSVFMETALYMFESDLHAEFRKKSHLSKNEIGELYTKHMLRYTGPFVESSREINNRWIGIPHIRSFFYVYSYVSGTLISKALQKLVAEDPKSISKVKDFMKAGSSASTEDIFENIGINISKKSFWEQGLSEIESMLEKTELLAKKLGKI